MLTIKQRKEILEGIKVESLPRAYSPNSVTYFYKDKNGKMEIKRNHENELDVTIEGCLDEIYTRENVIIKKGDLFSHKIKLFQPNMIIFEERNFIYCGSIEGLVTISNKIRYREFNSKELKKDPVTYCLYGTLPKMDKINFDNLLIKYSGLINNKNI